MTKHDYLRLADDGCPNCFTEWHWTLKRWPELPPPRAVTKARFGRYAGWRIRGPRSNLYFLSSHAVEQWVDRFGQPEAELVHAVRFSRVIGRTRGDDYRALWYEPDAAFFIAGRKVNCFTVMTCIPVWLLRKRRDIELIGRHRTRSSRRAA